MALFNDLTKKAAKFTEDAIDKTQEMAGNAKLKLKIKNLESNRDDVYRELGEYYYNLIENVELVDEEVAKKINAIHDLNYEIGELKDKLDEE